MPLLPQRVLQTRKGLRREGKSELGHMATMNSGLGGAAGYGEQSFRTSTVSGNLDDGFVTVNVTSVFGAGGMNINGTNYTSIFISSNGLITFASGVTSYTVSYTHLTLPTILRV